MDGVEATLAIRSLGGRFSELPIIALTANAISGMREMFLEKGFNDYLTKPIEISKLNDLMERWVPQEKRKKIENREEAADLRTESELKIEGIDVTRGIARTGGTEERYIRVLVLFCRDASERLEMLSEVPDEHSLPLFTTQVHALKSVLASIGAESLSRLAAELELCGRNGDIGAIRENLTGFCEALGTLVEGIRAALARSGAGLGRNESRPFDKTALLRLKDALASEDVGRIDRIMSELAKAHLGRRTSESLSKISDFALMSEFSAAIAEIDALLAAYE
jgi:CheY-like chemotaxis protein